jgi:DNA modification methylase
MLLGDVRAMLRTLPDDHFDCVVTSPPYWGLRDYDVEGQIGLEPTLGEHLAVMVDVFNEVRRVMKPSATLWLNYGDCYATSPNGRSAADTKAAGNDDRTFRDKPFSTVGEIYSPNHESGDRRGGDCKQQRNEGSNHPGRIVAIGGKRITAGEEREDVDVGGWGKSDDSIRWRGGGYLKPKDLCMIPNRLAIALQEAGWYVRSEIVWHKPNPMPESIKDRPGTSHEKVWLLSKQDRYFYDADAVAEPLAQSSVWRLAQDLESQTGSTRANGGQKTNGNMKAVGGQKPHSKEYGRKIIDGDSDLSAEGTSGAGFAPREAGRNLRNVWTIPTASFSDAHFATFPPALAERCIKAGSSEAGACVCCGAPWRRQTETTYDNPGNRTTNGPRSTDNRAQTAGFAVRLEKNVKTLGFAPTCDCPDASPIPSRILDIFGGAGTTALVAAQLGRTTTLIELNPEYATLARARIEAAFMGKEEGSRHMVKQLGKDKAPFGADSLFAGLEAAAE